MFDSFQLELQQQSIFLEICISWQRCELTAQRNAFNFERSKQQTHLAHEMIESLVHLCLRFFAETFDGDAADAEDAVGRELLFKQLSEMRPTAAVLLMRELIARHLVPSTSCLQLFAKHIPRFGESFSLQAYKVQVGSSCMLLLSSLIVLVFSIRLLIELKKLFRLALLALFPNIKILNISECQFIDDSVSYRVRL